MQKVLIRGIEYHIDQPEIPDFSIIDQLCIKCLQEQVPAPTETEAIGVKNGLRKSQFMALYDNQFSLVGLVYFSFQDTAIHLDFVCAGIKRQGIGSFLVELIIDLARKYKFEKVTLEASSLDVKVNNFYLRLGFKKCGEVIESIPLNIMEYAVAFQ